MENIVLRYVYDRRRLASADRAEPLYVEVRESNSNRCVLVNTGIKLYPNQFTRKNGFTCVNHDKASLVNVKAREVFRKVEKYALSDDCRELKDVHGYDTKKIYNASVVGFIEKKMREADLSTNQLKRHRGLITHLNRFGRIVLFSDVTLENIMLLETYLSHTARSQMARYKIHSILKHYVSLAVKLGYCKTNAYDDYRLRKGKSLKEPIFLEEDEIGMIRTIQLDERLSRVRDLFIFQCFTGLSYVDLMAFTPDWIYEADGVKVFRDARSKTGVGFFSVFLPEAEEILKKYYGVLPRYSNQKYNDYLKLIAIACGIKKHLTTHVARHTFATYLLNRDVPIETVSKAVGHTSIKQTQHYAKLLGKKVIRDMKKLL